MKKLLIIKLGGSVITDKTQDIPTPRLEIITNLAQQIAKLYKSGKYKIILVHGAGSYGHPLVKKYQLKKGIKTSDQKTILSQVQLNMLSLNSLIIYRLLQNNIPAICLPPHALVTQNAAVLTNFNTELIQKYVKQDYVPLLFGDGVFDIKQEASILSGDTIVCFLAQKLNPKKVIFLSDINGVFDKNPKIHPDAKLIKDINNDNLEFILNILRESADSDTTGSIYGKVKTIFTMLKGLDVLLMNGQNPKVLARLETEDPVGTRLLFH